MAKQRGFAFLHLRFAIQDALFSILLIARGATPAAFDDRDIPGDRVVSRSDTGDIPARRALSAGRIRRRDCFGGPPQPWPRLVARLGATQDLHHGLPALEHSRWWTALAVLSAALATSGLTPDAHWRVAGEGRGTPAVGESRVYFLTAHHEVVAASLAGGGEVWRQRTGEPGADTLGSLVVLCGSVVVAGDHAIYGFESATGAHRWRFSPKDDSGSGGYLGGAQDGVVFAGSRAGRLYAIDASTGQLRWSVLVSGTPGTTVFQPLVAEDLVLAGFTTFATPQTGGVVAIDRASGRVRWTREMPGERGPGGFAGGPAVADGGVIVAGSDGRIRGLAVDTGALRWELPGVTRSDGRMQERDWRALVVSGTTLVAGSLSGVITAFDLEARRERWRFALAEGGSVALRLTVHRDTVYVPHLGGRLVALSVADGHQRWQIGGLSDGFSWAPAVVGDVAYAAARGGLFALPR